MATTSTELVPKSALSAPWVKTMKPNEPNATTARKRESHCAAAHNVSMTFRLCGADNLDARSAKCKSDYCKTAKPAKPSGWENAGMSQRISGDCHEPSFCLWISKAKAASFFLEALHPCLDPCFEDIQRQRAVIQDLVVELADVELWPKFFGRIGAEFFQLQFADFVSQRLARPDDVAVDLDGDVVLALALIGQEVIDRLLPGPAHRIHACVHDQADGPPYFVGELTKPRVRIFVKAHFASETFRVQPPALDERGITAVFAKFGRLLHLLRQGNLQVMARNRFVQAQ